MNWLKQLKIDWITLVTVALTIVGILVEYNIYFLDSEDKSLNLSTVASTAIVEVSAQDSLNVSKDIEISYRSEPVKQLFFVEAILENSGKSPIKPEDYIKNIKLSFPSQALILEAKVAEAVPESIDMSALYTSNFVTLSKSLLNPGDKVTLQILTTSISEMHENLPFERVSSRIAGIKTINVQDRITTSNPIPAYLRVFLYLISTLLLASVVRRLTSSRRAYLEDYLAVLVSACTLAIAYIGKNSLVP